MYLLSDVESAYGLWSEACAAFQKKAGFLAFATVLAVVMFSLPFPANAQAQNAVDTQNERIQVENQVDINTADAETLALALDGVGMAKALDIIAYREQNGAFKSADDLQNVRGIGKATLERNRSRILITPVED